MQIYGLKNCDSCRKAMKSLPQAVLVDVRAEGIPSQVLNAALAQFGDALLNTRSTTWRALSEEERAEQPLDLIQAHPSVMKRPLIVTEEEMHLGWTVKTQAALGAA
ncbi:MAG: arsenate reductase family protein [Roseobacter sp.]